MTASPVSRLIRRAILPIAAVLLPLSSAAASPERFVVYYGESAAPDELFGFRRAVLDADHHPPLAPLEARGVELFGYLSVGEADTARSYFGTAEAAGVLLGSNSNWPGSHYVDVRKPAWRDLLLERVIPAIFAQGFEGLFLDTLDDAAFLEHADPSRNAGMIEASADLIREIRKRFPTRKLMLNRAFDVADLVASDLDSVLAESLASDYDFKTKHYRLRSTADLNWGLGRISKLKTLNPNLRIYTLDYCNPADRRGIARLYSQQRRAGFIPYVATIDLRTIVPEPAISTVGFTR